MFATVSVPAVAGWCLAPAVKGFAVLMLPGGMVFNTTNGPLIMMMPGWFAFGGTLPV